MKKMSSDGKSATSLELRAFLTSSAVSDCLVRFNSPERLKPQSPGVFPRKRKVSCC